MDGTIEKYKARLVAKGFSEDINFFDISTLACCITAISSAYFLDDK